MAAASSFRSQLGSLQSGNQQPHRRRPARCSGPRGRRGSCKPAASPSRSLFAALRASTSAPAESDRWGPPSAHRAAAIASTAAQTSACAVCSAEAAGRRRAVRRTKRHQRSDTTCPAARPSAPVASLPAAGSAWPGAQGARALARASRAYAARGHQLRFDRPDKSGLRTCAASARACSPAQRLAARRAFAALSGCGAPGAPAPHRLRSLRSLRVVVPQRRDSSLRHGSRPSLRCGRDPPGLRFAPACCAPPHPARPLRRASRGSTRLRAGRTSP